MLEHVFCGLSIALAAPATAANSKSFAFPSNVTAFAPFGPELLSIGVGIRLSGNDFEGVFVTVLPAQPPTARPGARMQNARG